MQIFTWVWNIMEGLFLFKLNPVLLDVSVLGPKLRGWSLDDPEADPRPDDWEDLGPML